MTDSREPHPKNVPGPFYVENGCCTACGVPEGEAPDLFGWDDNHCLIKKQPQTNSELYRMINAMMFSDLDCVRYRGLDETFLKRMAESGVLQQADFPPTYQVSEIYRDHVTFEVLGQSRPMPLSLAYDYRDYLSRSNADLKFRGPRRALFKRGAWLKYSWYKNDFHRVRFMEVAANRNKFCGVGSWATIAHLHDWLESNSNYSNVMWFTSQQWNAGETNGARWPR